MSHAVCNWFDLPGLLRVSLMRKQRAHPVEQRGVSLEGHILDVVSRNPAGRMLLTSDELIGFVHLPSSTVRSPVFSAMPGKTAAPRPSSSTSKACYWETMSTPEKLFRSGSTRTTHSTRPHHRQTAWQINLAAQHIRQLIENGSGVAVLDPHGDLVQRMPGLDSPERIDDGSCFDPADEYYSVGFNILSAFPARKENLLASDLVSMFQRLSTSWGDQMDSVFPQCRARLSKATAPARFTICAASLLEPSFQADFLTSVRDANVLYYWQKFFPRLGDRSVPSIATRLNEFLMQAITPHAG